MWLHKTPEDIAAEHKKLWSAFGGPLGFSLLLFILLLIVCLLRPSYRGGVSYRPFTFVERLVFTLKFALISSVIAFPCAYLLQVWLKRPIWSILSSYQTKVMICNKCFQVKSADDKPTCDCGGTFELFDLWKWVND
jgi:hypothetical protein